MLREERDYDEKRDFYRMAVNCKVSYQLRDSAQEGEGTCLNLSAGGVLFETGEPLEPGVGLQIRISPESSITGDLDAVAQVARCDDAENGSYLIAAAIVEINR